MIAKKSGVGTMRAEIGHSRPPFARRDQNNLNATPFEDDVIGDPVLLVFDRTRQMECVRASLQRLQDDRPRGSLGIHPPVLVLPNAMGPDVCAQLINTWSNPVPLWEGDGKNSIGLNIEKSDVKVRNAAYGNCAQYVVRDTALSTALDDKVLRRVVPKIEKAFAYSPSKREEYRIACYDVADGGSLPEHRDNPTAETRHRRFTVSINLNNDDFKGG
jgi:hypothetical protein